MNRLALVIAALLLSSGCTTHVVGPIAWLRPAQWVRMKSPLIRGAAMAATAIPSHTKCVTPVLKTSV